MIIIGQILIAIGFLVGTVSTSFDKELVNWNMFGGAMVLGIVGIIMVAVGRKRSANARSSQARLCCSSSSAVGQSFSDNSSEYSRVLRSVEPQ